MGITCSVIKDLIPLYVDDVLSEDNAHQIVSIAYRATNVFHLVAVSVAICHRIGNHDPPRLRLIGSVSFDAFECGRTVGIVVTVGELVAVLVGNGHLVSPDRGG